MNRDKQIRKENQKKRWPLGLATRQRGDESETTLRREKSTKEIKSGIKWRRGQQGSRRSTMGGTHTQIHTIKFPSEKIQLLASLHQTENPVRRTIL